MRVACSGRGSRRAFIVLCAALACAAMTVSCLDSKSNKSVREMAGIAVADLESLRPKAAHYESEGIPADFSYTLDEISSELKQATARLKALNSGSSYTGSGGGIDIEKTNTLTKLKKLHMLKMVMVLNTYDMCTAKAKGVILSGDASGSLKGAFLKQADFSGMLGSAMLQVEKVGATGTMDLNKGISYSVKGKEYDCSYYAGDEKLPKKWQAYYKLAGLNVTTYLPLPPQSVTESMETINAAIDSLQGSLKQMAELAK